MLETLLQGVIHELDMQDGSAVRFSAESPDAEELQVLHHRCMPSMAFLPVGLNDVLVGWKHGLISRLHVQATMPE